MAPSPRKTTAPAFKHTWDATDSSFLDPTALSIAKAPRAWDRKQETKTVGGKQKKVWRRYTTRSRTANVAPEEDDHEDHDARSRPVKKLQRMSPQAIEKSTKLQWPRVHAFKATRWDRRKSVLPSMLPLARPPKQALTRRLGKNATRADPANDDVENANGSSDAEDADVSNNNFSEMDASAVSATEPTPVTEHKDSRSTFTFSMQDDQESTIVDDTAGTSMSLEAPQTEQEATLVNFFRSPVKNAVFKDMKDSPEKITYPELPQPVVIGANLDGSSEETTNTNEAQPQTTDGCPSAETPALAEETADAEPMDMSEAQEAVDKVLVAEVSYPSLPTDESIEEQVVLNEEAPEQEGQDESESDSEIASMSAQDEETLDTEVTETPTEGEFTEASLQLNIQRDMEEEQFKESSVAMDTAEDQSVAVSAPEEDLVLAETPQEESLPEQNVVEDIADGLSLGPATTPVREPTPRKMQSPPPPPAEHGSEETLVLDDDTAMLKDFLSRAAASKASKAATISRRESLQNRRDSDVVRHALASPRVVLEEKDPNSPTKHDNEATLDLSQTLTMNMDQPPLSPTPTSTSMPEQASTEPADDTAPKTSRRSSRTRKSRLPAPASTQPAGPSKIAVRRADGGEPVVLKKSDVQELSQLTRTNTRKNKQGAFAVHVRLLKLSKEMSRRASDDDTANSEASVVQVPGKKYVRWDEQLAYFQEGTDTVANMLAEAESLATPDELSLPATAAPKSKIKAPKPKEKKAASTSTPKIRRVRGLGTTNGTPGKGLLNPASLLPDAVQEEKEQAANEPSSQQRLPKPKANARPKTPSKTAKKMPVAPTTGSSDTAAAAPTLTAAPSLEPTPNKLPSLDIAPVGIETATAARKSKLASPRKVRLPPPPGADGKENSRGASVGISGNTPKKGIPVLLGIPGGMGVVGGGASAGGETGLPRRRLRKL